MLMYLRWRQASTLHSKPSGRGSGENTRPSGAGGEGSGLLEGEGSGFRALDFEGVG